MDTNAVDLKSRIRSDLVTARKQRDKARVLVLTTLLSDIRNQEIESGGALDDEGVVRVLTRGIKQRADAAEQMRRGGREDVASIEEAQAELLRGYLPEAMSEEEVRSLVRRAMEAGVTQMGPLMAHIMPTIRGRFDGKEANRIVREELGT